MSSTTENLEKQSNVRRPWALHPWMLAAFPPSVAIQRGVVGTSVGDLIITFVLSYSVTVIFWITVRSFVKDNMKRSLIISCWLVLFFSYALILRTIRGTPFVPSPLARERFVLLGVAILGGMGGLILTRIKLPMVVLTKGLNLASLALVVLGVTGILRSSKNLLGEYILSTKVFNHNAQSVEVGLPDIYYIVPDMYGSEQTLRDVYSFDNSEFINFLRHEGFYVADKSVSNYPITYNSFAASLNMGYINYLEQALGEESDDMGPTARMIQASLVMRTLKARGYEIITFDSGLEPTRTSKLADTTIQCCWAGEAATNLLEMTPLNILDERFTDHGARILCILAELEKVKGKSPYFVFARIVCPHMPFIFGPNGERKDRSNRPEPQDKVERYREGYTDQVLFMNTKLKAVVKQILDRPGKKPIIIIQGDHGPDSLKGWRNPSKEFLRERFGILNAYYVPEKFKARLYPSITPVNSFRILLSGYKGENYPLLPDRSFFNTYERPYAFREVTEEVTSRPRGAENPGSSGQALPLGVIK